MSTPVSVRSPNGAGGSTTRRNALTGRQLQLVMEAAHTAMLAHGEVTPSKAAKLARKFSEQLARKQMTFHEYLAHAAHNPPADTGLRSLLGYLDPTGAKAARNVDRSRCR